MKFQWKEKDVCISVYEKEKKKRGKRREESEKLNEGRSQKVGNKS